MWNCSLIRLLVVAGLCLLPSLRLAGQTRTSLSAELGADASHIEEALKHRGSIDFVERPLRDVVPELSRQFKVPVVLSFKKLEEASVSPETPITKKFYDLTFESILRLLLKDLELTYVVRDEVLQITTPEDAESQLITRVYPVLDLVTVGKSRPPKSGFGKDYDSLIDVIIATIQPDSWDDVGGPGAIDALGNAGSLVISQTSEVHGQIEGLLAALRKAKALQGLVPSRSAAGQQGLYDPARLPDLVREVTHVDAWQVPQLHSDRTSP